MHVRGPQRRRKPRRLSIEGFRQLASQRGGRCLSKTYRVVHEHLLWRCAKGHDWQATAANVLYGGSWCPLCGKDGNEWSTSRLNRDLLTSVERLAARSATLAARKGRPDEGCIEGWIALGERSVPDPEAIVLAHQLLEGIDRRDARIVARRFGLTGFRESLEEIGASLGITKERVRQIVESALLRLRKLGERLTDDELPSEFRSKQRVPKRVILPPRPELSRRSAGTIARRLRHARKPTRAMRELMNRKRSDDLD